MAAVAPYGSWRSPIGAEAVARAGRRLGGATLAADGAVWWAEGRPAEQGRTALMRRPPGGAPEEVTPAGANVRTRVHEYGGGAWALAGPELVLFVDFADQRLYRQRLGEQPQAIVPAPPAPGAWRYADLRVVPGEGGGGGGSGEAGGATVVCVRELHGEGEAENQIVALPLWPQRSGAGSAVSSGSEASSSGDPASVGGGEARVLAAGRDFYSFPRPSPDGRWLAWTCWDHPNMPWDGTELWLAPLADPGAARRLAGGPEESVFQPEWDAAGRLHFVSDRDGWWNLYGLAEDAATAWEEAAAGCPGTAGAARSGGGAATGGAAAAPTPGDDAAATVQLSAERADLGHPQWLFGGSTYAFLTGGAIACVCTERGEERLALLEPGTGRTRDLGLPHTDFGFPAISARGEQVAFAAAGPAREAAVVVYDVAAGGAEEVRKASEEELDRGCISTPRAIEFPTSEGDTGFAFFYPPANAGFAGPPGERPPLIVKSHGGPTSHATPALDRETLYWTSRGFGVVDVNYRGSSGYGRAYRNRLRGRWGVFDSEDCVAAARFLAAGGEADAARLAIRGGSAGGYATLCALVFHDEFAAGASYYGVADAETLASDTHKFESRYLDSLIGPYPERADLYRKRSPIHHVERLRAAAILFQGLEDEIVPPSQAETMVAALRANGVPHAYLAFAGEQHGFRQAETEIRCLEAELYFYGRVLGFDPADRLEPVAIQNLKTP